MSNNVFFISDFEKHMAPPWALKQRKLIYGVGVNDVPYKTVLSYEDEDGNLKKKNHPIYYAWQNMLARSFSEEYKKSRPTYEDVTLSEEWHLFSNFYQWFKEHCQDERCGYQVDKDHLLIGNTTYAPQYCVLMPSHLNSFLLDSPRRRGRYKIGVQRSPAKAERYISVISINGYPHNLGSFATEEEAHLTWKAKKLELAHELKEEYDAIDPRLFPNVILKIKGAV